MIEIEPSDPRFFKCECCGGKTTSITRFISRDGRAYSIFYGLFSENHPESGVAGLVSLGNWDDETDHPDRDAFAFWVRVQNETFATSMMDVSASHWPNTKVMGRKLTRQEALEHGRIHEVFELIDYIVVNDREISSFFDPVQ